MRLGDKNIENDIRLIRADVAMAVTPGQTTDHGSLLGLADDDHSQYVHISAIRTISARHAFNPTSPNSPFTLGANAQNQLVNGFLSDHVNKNVSAGSGLSGGGSLSSGSGVTLNITAENTSMQINADSIQVRLASNPGLEVATGLKLGTPGTLTVSTSNGLSGASHTHAITASSDVSAGAAAILKSTAAGGLGLASMFTTGAVDVGQGFTSGATSLRAIHHTHGGVDHTHLVINPSGSWSLDEQFGVDIDDNLLVRGWIVGKHALQIPDALMIVHFDGPEPYETNFTGEAIGHMGQVPTQTGGVIFRPGKFGKGVSVGYPATNQLKNPQFYYNYTDDWNFFDSVGDGAIYRKTDRSYVGLASVQLIANTGGQVYIRSATSIPVANGQTVWLQARIWRYSQTPTFILDFWDQTNSTQRGQMSTLTKNQEWELVTTSWTNNTGSLVYVRAEVRHTTGNATSSIFVDAVQLELDNLTQYLDGSLGLQPGQVQSDSASGNYFNGHAWSGTAHNSTSSRTQGVLTYNLDMPDNPSTWTVSFWFRPVMLNTEATVYHNIFQWRYDDNNRVLTAYNPTNGYLYTSFTGNGSNSTINYTSALTRDEWHHAAITYDDTTVTFYLNGVKVGDATPTSMVSVPNILRFGYAANNFPGFLDDLAIAGACFDADLIRAIYESNAPLFAESSTWHWRAAENLLWADSEGLWMYDQDGVPVLGVSGADNKSWGGATLNKGDILYGRYGAADGGWMWFDRDGVSNKPYLKMGYADQTVWQFDYGGATLNGVLDISSSGGIYQGSSGSFGSPGTGLKMWNDGGVGRIFSYSGGTPQAGFDSTGKIIAGGNKIWLDANGAQAVATTSWQQLRTYQLVKSDGTWLGGLGAWYSGTQTLIDVRAEGKGGGSTLRLYADDTGSGTPHVVLLANGASLDVGGSINEIYTPDALVADRIHVSTSTGSSVSSNDLWVDVDARIGGGLYVGGLGVNPAVGNIIATAQGRFGGGLFVGDIGVGPSTGYIYYTQALVKRVSAVNHIVYGLHFFTNPGTHTSWDGDPYSTSQATIDFTTGWTQNVPSAATAVLISVVCKDSASWGTSGLYFAIGPDSTYWLHGSCRPHGGDIESENTMLIPTGGDGTCYYHIVASGTGTMDITIRVLGYAV